jgi:hypothetical protein
MRSFVRYSLIGLVALVAIGFVVNQQQVNSDEGEVLPVVSEGMCTENGTSLVIDFGTSQSTPVIEKCVENFTGYSWDLFEAAEINVSGTEKYPVGFVCRINNFPGEKTEKCKETPGTKNGSWAYFLADDTGNWKYSPIGAATHKVKCGKSEGWRFLLPGEPVQTPPRVTLKNNVCTN